MCALCYEIYFEEVNVKQVSEVPVEIDELSLSLLGWAVQDFRARVTTEQYKTGGEYFHQLAVSGLFRFNSTDWVDRFNYSGEEPVYPVMLLRSPSLSTKAAITALRVSDISQGRSGRVAMSGFFVNTYSSIDHSDLRIQLTAMDSVDADGDITEIPIETDPLPMELIDESSSSSIQLTFDQFEAFTHRCDRPDERLGQIRASGRVTFGTPDQLFADWVSRRRYPTRRSSTLADAVPFIQSSPDFVFDILDSTGFLLDQIGGEVDIHIHVDERGQAPSRVPRWLIDLRFDPSDYSVAPDRIIARIEGD